MGTAQAHLNNGRVRRFTRSGLDWTKRFPAIAADVGLLPAVRELGQTAYHLYLRLIAALRVNYCRNQFRAWNDNFLATNSDTTTESAGRVLDRGDDRPS